MNPSDLIPAADAIPVHWLWFKVLLVLTFVLHILFMNVLLGGAILSFWGNLRQGPGNDFGSDFSRRLPVVTAMTINLGVAPLLFLQVIYGNFIYVSSVLGAVYWLSVFVLLIIAYYGLYIYLDKYEALQGARILVSGLIAVCLLLVTFFFVNNMTMMDLPKQWLAYFDNPNGTIINWGDPTLIPRYLHFVVASVAVAGLFTAIVAQIRRSKDPGAAEARIKQGMQYFAWGTVVQIFIGLWLLISLQREVLLLFMGGGAYATVLFILSLAVIAGTLIAAFKGMVWPTVFGLVVAVSGMALIRDLVRDAYLEPYQSLSGLKVVSQVSPLILFLTTFVVGLVIVGYMFKIYFSAEKVG